MDCGTRTDCPGARGKKGTKQIGGARWAPSVYGAETEREFGVDERQFLILGREGLADFFARCYIKSVVGFRSRFCQIFAQPDKSQGVILHNISILKPFCK